MVIEWERPSCSGEFSNYILVLLGGSASYDTEMKVRERLEDWIKIGGDRRAKEINRESSLWWQFLAILQGNVCLKFLNSYSYC